MTQPIEVRISDSDLMTQTSVTTIISRLKAAGIPVKGTFFFDGVESGELRQFREDHHTVYVWYPNE